ncbi:MAG TPA: DUF937 domain-containing protein [Rhizobiales bacterium]|nr:DUF937 domain-containing protein [Hyphomicrobiales bacterium]
MELLDILSQAQGGKAFQAIGEQFGLDEQQTAAAVEQLAPVIAAGLRRNMASSPDSVAGVLEALQRGNHERYLDDADAVQFANASDEGNAILGHVFGSKDVSRQVAMQVAGTSGIGSSILKQLLPVIASMVMGSLARKMGGGAARPAPRRSGGGLGDIIGDVLGGGSSRGGGGLGNIIGDVLGGGRRPAPAPAPQRQSRTRSQSRGGGGLGDILGDILGGGSSQPQTGSAPRRYNEEAIGSGRSALDDILGRGTRHGNAADDLLNSVERHLGRM